MTRESTQRVNEEDEEHEYASSIEAFIDKYLAPEILSNQGRVFILVAWCLATFVSIMGAKNI